jgi:hypothetical protein
MESPSEPAPATGRESTPFDDFFSPTNYEFYSNKPYQSLDKSKSTIRLLKVLQHNKAGDFRCALTDAIALSEAHGTYTAVSYCARDPKNTRSVEVNGVQFNAFANLVVALDETCHYRMSKYGDEAPLLWVDQICMNQSNTDERSHQVDSCETSTARLGM